MKKAAYLLLLPILFCITANNAIAYTQSNITITNSGSNASSTVNSTINSSSNTTIQTNSNSNISVSSNGGGNNSVVINNNTFKLEGKITSISSNTFSVSGQQIQIDKSKVSDFIQNGELKVGNNATVEGIIINNTLYAKKIVTSTSDNSDTNTNSKISVSVNNESQPIESTMSGNATGSAKNETQISQESKNVIEQLIKSLESLITNLKSILNR